MLDRRKGSPAASHRAASSPQKQFMVAGEVIKREIFCILRVCLGNGRFSLRILHQGDETRMGMGKGTSERHAFLPAKASSRSDALQSGSSSLEQVNTRSNIWFAQKRTSRFPTS